MATMKMDDLEKLIDSRLVKFLKERDEARSEIEKAAAAEAAKAHPPAWLAKLMSGQIEEPRTLEKGVLAASVVRAIAAGKGDPERATSWVAKHWKEKDAFVAEQVTKALAAGEATAGGFLVPTVLSQDIIELLRPMAVVRSMGPVILPMPAGSVRIPKLTAGSAASYIGENVVAPKTQPTFGQVMLAYKKLAALVPVSNDLLRYSSPGADSIVRDDLVRAMAQREDQAFLRDDGTSATPRGLRYWAPAANLLTMTGTGTLAEATSDLGRMIQVLKDGNVPMTRPGWLMSPRTERFLMTIQNTNGFYVFRAEMLAGKLWSIPYKTTTQIPNTLSPGTASELYLVDFADTVIGDSQNLIVDASTEAAYDDNGTTRAAFSLDQTVIRAIAEHDFAARRDVAIVVLTGLTWGA